MQNDHLDMLHCYVKSSNYYFEYIFLNLNIYMNYVFFTAKYIPSYFFLTLQ